MTEDNNTNSALKADVDAIHKRWWSALVNADASELDTLLPGDFFYYNPYGGSSTKAEILEHLHSGQLKYNSIKDNEPLIRMYGQTAIVTGRADIQFQWEGQPILLPVNYTAVYCWIDRQWCLLMYQSTQREAEN